jgi:aspartate aminotransferase
MMATLNEGDEVIIPAPYWVSYPDMVLLAGGKPKILECNEKQGFKINPAELEKSITKKTKWIISKFTIKSNGCLLFKKDIKEISKVLIKQTCSYLSDDIYEHVRYEILIFLLLLKLKT